jgi:hypothetical protein
MNPYVLNGDEETAAFAFKRQMVDDIATNYINDIKSFTSLTGVGR